MVGRGNLQEIPMENGPPAHPPIQNSLKSWEWYGSHLWDRTRLGVPEQIPQEIWYGKTSLRLARLGSC